MNYQQARLSTLARTVYSLHSRHVIRQHGFLSSGVSCRRWSSNSSLSSLLQPSEEVATALATGAPVVALESTIISHGMPYPQNLTTAQAVEDIVREHGCTPATIAILGGKIRVGLSEQELDVLAQTGHEARKTSRRDIAYAVSKGIPAATTVASTMIIAHLAGIPVFVTGGIGGVHRGAEHTMDISADLTELGRTPVAVICAGAKSILDIEKPSRVTVATYGSDEFPAFFTPYRDSRYTTKECASLIDVAHRLQLASGQVIAVPIPEKYAANGREIQTAIDNALAESVEQKITGKDATPFLLDRVNNSLDASE
ncbi:pseudouridine-5'-phosphate glycosidase [Syncephalis plumigaleata]|nr:pseudouridine-5'-phosphate glycosidase [Syncephalis plumigaleata]